MLSFKNTFRLDDDKSVSQDILLKFFIIYGVLNVLMILSPDTQHEL